MKMSDRKRLVLAAVVTLHGDSGDPVGSNHLGQFLQQVAVSSATLRNEMAGLTALGLLEQPHTSAGRVPSQLGVRYYIDNLMEPFPMTIAERRAINEIVLSMDTDPERAAEASAKELADLFGLAAMALTPKSENPHFVHFRVIRVGRFSLAVVGVTSSGSVRSRVCRLEKEPTETEIEALQNMLNKCMVFVSAEDVEAVCAALPLYAFSDTESTVFRTAVAIIRQTKDARLYSGGESNLFRFRDIENQMGAFLELINDRDRVSRLLTIEEDCSIAVGQDMDLKLPGMSTVIKCYHAGALTGSIAVVGPIRMNYSYILPRVRYFGDCLSEKLTA